MIFQTEIFFAHTNERHDNLLRSDYRIPKWEHQNYWNNFAKPSRKPVILNIDRVMKTNV